MKRCHPDSHDPRCPLCRLYSRNEEYRRSVDGESPRYVAVKNPNRVPVPIVRPERCNHFLGRTEFRPGCGGWKCRGGCTLGLTAVPGVACQSCERYEVDPDFAGRGTSGWLS
jgi:hypothetical protein